MVASLTKADFKGYTIQDLAASDYPTRLWINFTPAENRLWYRVENRKTNGKWEFNDFQDALDKFNEESR